jgi:hypothetical protein
LKLLLYYLCGSYCKNDDVTLHNFLLINIRLENGQRNKKKKINFLKRKRKIENLQGVVQGFSLIGSLGSYNCPCTDLSELEDAISCDRKVQVKFQTDFFCLCMSFTQQNYQCVPQSELQKDVCVGASPHFHVGKGVDGREGQT